MEPVGIDLGARRCAICIVSSGGIVERETTVKTQELAMWLAKLPGSRVIVESCAESRRVAMLASECGHEVRIVPTQFVRTLGIGIRRIKTDKRDARSIALASFRLGEQLPRIHIRSDESAATLNLVNSRKNLIAMRTRAINFVRAQMRQELVAGPTRAALTFVRNVREMYNDTPVCVEVQLQLIEQLNARVGDIDVEIAKLAKREPETRLRKLAGVGPLIAVMFRAVIDDATRFATGAQVASYVGLSPGENTTGFNIRRTKIVAAGQCELRRVLVQGAHSAQNSRSHDPMVVWARQLCERRGRKLATCALARKLAVVMWAMLRNETHYDPRLNKPRELSPVLPDLLAS